MACVGLERRARRAFGKGGGWRTNERRNWRSGRRLACRSARLFEGIGGPWRQTAAACLDLVAYARSLLPLHSFLFKHSAIHRLLPSLRPPSPSSPVPPRNSLFAYARIFSYYSLIDLCPTPRPPPLSLPPSFTVLTNDTAVIL